VISEEGRKAQASKLEVARAAIKQPIDFRPYPP
jgi:hypothetical protein